MTELVFKVKFLAPFAVATGVAKDGMDTTIDRDNPLPSSAIKGILKAQLRDVLGAPEPRISEIFHSGEELGWVFSDTTASTPTAQAPEVGLWTRVEVGEGGRAAERMLMIGEQAGATKGEFKVTWEGGGTAPPEQARALRAAARCITSLGSHRRRGLGWVAITDDQGWTAQDTKMLRQWLAG